MSLGIKIGIDSLLMQGISVVKDGSEIEITLGDIVILSITGSPILLRHQVRKRKLIVSALVDSEHNIRTTRKSGDHFSVYTSLLGCSIELVRRK